MEQAYIVPKIVKETSMGMQTYSIVDDMLAHREIELCGAIDAAMVNSLIQQLRYLQREDPEAEITMFINSLGGEVSSGLALYDVMRAISCPIRTVCLGTAASMASLLFMSGDRRDMLPHSRLMVHDPLISGGGISGPALSVKAASDNLMRIREIIAQVIAEHSGKTLDEVYELTAKDTYFEAGDAVKSGLADRVIDTL